MMPYLIEFMKYLCGFSCILALALFLSVLAIDSDASALVRMTGIG